ncbi:unnamed protein product [Rhizophagus irregularis]|nr:unnamed protein product [Rhizophagus irregularis]
MNETRFSQSYFPQHFANRSEESKWQKSKENDIYKLERALFPMELLCQTSHQESNSQETKGISLTEPGSFEETVHKDRTKKGIPSIYDKPYTQQNKEIQAQSFSLPITSETARNNEIKCKRTKSGSKDEVREYDDILRDKSCPNRARIESIQASMGKLCRIDCYGRVFELDRMSDALWPLGNSLEEAATKPWTGEVAWDVDEDGVVFEWEYYTEAERTTHDFKRADDKKPWKLEGVYKEIPDKNKSKKKKSKKSKKNSTIF